MTRYSETETIRNAYNAAYQEEVDRLYTAEGIKEFSLVCKIIEKYLKKSENVIYDIGSGSGKYTKYFLNRGESVGCIDISENLINYFTSTIQNELKENLLFSKNCCASDLEWLPKNSADLILLMGPMYHLTDIKIRRKVWQNMNKMLKNGGYLVTLFLKSLELNSKMANVVTNTTSYRKMEEYDISHVSFGGFSVPQFRCNPDYAAFEAKDWFDVIEIDQFSKIYEKNFSKSKKMKEINSDQYAVIYRKK